MDKLAEAKKVFDMEILALEKTKEALDDTFVKILDMITSCKGKVIITGMGKPGHIAKKIAATMASLGTPAFCLHPAEALHGDLGMISENDVVIAISYSGESDEITRILPNIKMIGAKIVALSGNANSTLVKYSDLAQILPTFNEACYLGLAPTSSTTVVLCYGDALAVVASGLYGFKDTDFGKYHPAGSLGKKLLIKVSDLMKTDDNNAVVSEKCTLKEAIVELSKKGLGIVNVINDKKQIVGVITDGDLRRLLEKGVDIYNMNVAQAMIVTPTLVMADLMAVDALKIMKEKNISCLPVITENKIVIGTIRLQSIIQSGILL
ncbi:KpsF/GutQ family sugar-phosphate isomerase [Clostridium chromiireducens]|uniref:KpsF/GutQ family sugar-phosphate isomerase n=1 Tax=Clostridium chromiireducens TaxID=225345 RepID=UPI003AF7AF20